MSVRPIPRGLPRPGDTAWSDPPPGGVPGAYPHRVGTCFAGPLPWGQAQAPAREASQLWWLHPLTCIAAVALVYALFAGFDFERVVPRAYIPSPMYAWGAVLLLAMAVGAAVIAAGRSPGPLRAEGGLDVPAWVMGLLLATTVFAYLLWFQPLIANPQLLLDILRGQRSNLRNVITTMPGVTTMTQFGVAYVIAHAALRGGQARPIAAWEHLGLAAVLGLAIVRSLAWSERLAVIELVVCYLVAYLAFVRVRRAAVWRAATVVPMMAPIALYVMFTATEYFRSWDFYRDQYASIWAFSLERLLAYYATASNNGIGQLAESRQWPMLNGRYALEWLYLMPVVGDELRALVGDAKTQYMHFLDQYLRPEFNNPSGLFPIVYDLGYIGSMLYFLGVGALIGRLHMAWRGRATGGVLFYPVAVLFLVELLRFNYFASSRFFPVALALAVVWMASRRTAPRWQGAGP